MSPFKLVYGRDSPDIPSYVPLSSKVQAVDLELTRRSEILETVKRNLKKAQVKMKKAADKKRTHITFEVGDKSVGKVTAL